MEQGGIRDGAVDMSCDRERWVHENDARYDRAIEMIVDVRGVMAGDANVGKKLGQQSGARLRQLVQDEAAAYELRKDGEQAGPG